MEFYEGCLRFELALLYYTHAGCDRLCFFPLISGMMMLDPWSEA